MSIHDKLLALQTELKAPKSQYNSFGKYKYRSCEGILEAAKPILRKHGLVLTLSDELTECAGEPFIRARATLTDPGEPQQGRSYAVTAYAQIARNQKGMDVSQITGAASSYARKYALNGLFLIDDAKDADTDEYQGTQNPEKPVKRISQTTADVLSKVCRDLDITVEKLLAQYGVKGLTDLTEEQYCSIMNRIRRYQEKQEKESTKDGV